MASITLPPPLLPSYDLVKLSSSLHEENSEYGLPPYFEFEYPDDNPNDWLPPSYKDDECPPEYYTLTQARLRRRARGLAALATTRGSICEQIDSSSIARINSYLGGKALWGELALINANWRTTDRPTTQLAQATAHGAPVNLPETVRPHTNRFVVANSASSPVVNIGAATDCNRNNYSHITADQGLGYNNSWPKLAGPVPVLGPYSNIHIAPGSAPAVNTQYSDPVTANQAPGVSSYNDVPMVARPLSETNPYHGSPTITGSALMLNPCYTSCITAECPRSLDPVPSDYHINSITASYPHGPAIAVSPPYHTPVTVSPASATNTYHSTLMTSRMAPVVNHQVIQCSIAAMSSSTSGNRPCSTVTEDRVIVRKFHSTSKLHGR